MLKLRPLGSDRVTVRGVIRDADGAPVGGAVIRDMEDPVADFTTGRCRSVGREGRPLAVSAADGSFRFSCYADEVQIYATSPAGDYTAARWYQPGTHVGETLAFYRTLGSATGRMLDAHGDAIAGLTVYLFRRGCRFACEEFVTDQAGRYVLPELKPGGDYCAGASGDVSADFCFRAIEGSLELGDFVVDSIETTTLHGTVRARGGIPVGGARVTVAGRTVATHPNGSFELQDVEARLQTVTVRHPDYVKFVTQVVVNPLSTSIVVELTPARADESPSGDFTWSRGDGKLVVGGYAKDDRGVARVKVAVRNIKTGRWLHRNGSWGRFELQLAETTDPGARRTDWRFKWRLRPGKYGVSLVVVDTAGQRNPVPRPWRVVTVLR